MSRKWMNVITVLAAGLLVAAAGCTTGDAPAGTSDRAAVGTPSTSFALKTDKDKISYSYGVETARNFRRQGMDIDPDVLLKGMKDVMAGDKLLLSDEELLNFMNQYAGRVRQNQGRAKLIAAQDNKKEGDEFLAANKTKEGVVTLPSGLQYKILKAGDGRKPTEADTVECQYRGTLINGTEFYDTKGQAATFNLSDGSIILGLREAIKLMPVGSKWQLFVPPQLAYSSKGAGQYIGPNATLIFEVELLAIE
jgi:FKBP-type peptidyl-prolyl cis-trans isomerase